jgi:hypothetical protein
MATFDSLAGDHRAVLQLVLARRRGYEEIAGMLSIGPDVVRARALGALDALGGPTDVPADERQLICDYLLGQLPSAQVGAAQELLAASPAARAWAVGLTPALEPVSVDPLPRIPPAAPVDATAVREPAAPAHAPAAPEPLPTPAADEAAERPPSSRRGGMVVIGLALGVIVAAVVVLVVTLVNHHHSHPNRDVADATHSSTATTTATTSSSSTSAAKPLAQINLRPTAAGSKAAAVVVVFRQGSVDGIEMVGQHIPPNKHNSYEVWLYSSPSHFEKLGFVSPAVGRNGRLSVVNALPKNAGSYRTLIVTTEAAGKQPTHPGPILLRGTLTGLS